MQSGSNPIHYPEIPMNDSAPEGSRGRPLGPIRIWEPLCVLERILEGGMKGRRPALESLRWIAVEQKDAGSVGEHVLYRRYT